MSAECEAKCDTFFCTGLAGVEKFKKELAPEEAEFHDSDFVLCLPGWMIQNLELYRAERQQSVLVSLAKVVAEAGGRVNAADKVALREMAEEKMASEPCVASINQKQGRKGQHMGQSLGTIIRNSRLWSFKHKRLLTGAEALLAQGILTEAPMPEHPYVSLLPPLDTYTNNALIQLAGNAIHATVAASLTLFVFGSLELGAAGQQLGK